MNKHQKDTWLSVHLFYNEPWEEFLQKALEPYVTTAIQTGIANSYFFIRYWENGPHIRLRMKGDSEMVNTILKPNLDEHFQNYFDSIPSVRMEPKYPPNFSEDLKWYPNNSMKFMEFNSEENRFGGDVGVLLAHQQFMVSSKTVLELINRKGKSWSYDDAMGAGIKLHLAFVHSAGLDLENAIQFFDFFIENWLPYTFQQKAENLQPQEVARQQLLSKKAFEESFDTQKENLIPFHKVLWEALKNGDEFEEPILNFWISENKILLKSLFLENKSGNLKPRSEEFAYPVKPKINSENELLWSIFADFLHLTNNRLGIVNRDESYLCYMMKMCLVELKKNEKVEAEG